MPKEIKQYICRKRVFVTENCSNLVEQNDPAARILLAHVGQEVSPKDLAGFDEKEVDEFFVDAEEYVRPPAKPPAVAQVVLRRADSVVPNESTGMTKETPEEAEKDKAKGKGKKGH